MTWTTIKKTTKGKVLGEWMYSSTHSLTSALDGGEWSASRPGRFTPRERDPDIHWIGGWVDPRAILDMVVQEELSEMLLKLSTIPTNPQLFTKTSQQTLQLRKTKMHKLM
jgi:hypothetical protein